jgi:hypothetical protein
MTVTGSWWPLGCLATGIALIALAVVPVVLSGPSNPYSAMMLAVLGLASIAGACALVAFGMARRWADLPLAVAAAGVAAVPPLAVILGSASLELRGVAVYVAALAAANWLLERRSPPAIALAALAVACLAIVSVIEA